MLSPLMDAITAAVTSSRVAHARVYGNHYDADEDDVHVQVLSGPQQHGGRGRGGGGGGGEGAGVIDYVNHFANSTINYVITAVTNNDVITNASNDSDVTVNCDYGVSESGECTDDELTNAFMYYLWTFVTPCLFAAILLVGATGNLLVIYVILSRPEMRSITNIMLVSLALADVAFLFICIPFNAYKYAAESWSFGDAACKFAQYFLYVAAYGTIYTLVAISALRYATVVTGSATAQYRTKRNAVILAAAIWIGAATANISTLPAFTVQSVTNSSYTYCGIEQDVVYSIHLSFFALGYALPMFIITVLYVLIAWHLASHKPTSACQTRARERNARTLRIIILVVLVFGISWLPTHAQAIASYFVRIPNGEVYQVLRILWNCMAYGNSCANPIIYHCGSQEFRKSFGEVCSKVCPRLRCCSARSTDKVDKSGALDANTSSGKKEGKREGEKGGGGTDGGGGGEVAGRGKVGVKGDQKKRWWRLQGQDKVTLEPKSGSTVVL